MNKNAYEIRLEILKMAHDDAVGRYHHRIGVERENAERSATSFDSTLIESLFPSSQDVLTKAEELYKFVENK